MIYRAGIYCRISREEKKKKGEYSNSIQSQIQIAKDYLTDQKDVREEKIYVDDGASGKDFERREFQKMLREIEQGILNMVILKDISRLGREQIGTNYYLGYYFPEKRVRVVSVLDGYDSSVSAYDELLEMKILLHDMYLRETSDKIKSTIRTKRSMGEYTAKEPPFGYVKSKTIRNHLEVDPYAADIVSRIYRMYLSGRGCTVISRVLNEAQIPSPAKYKKEILGREYTWKAGKGLWIPSTVRAILKNPVYTGAVVLRKYERLSYKLHDRKGIPLEKQELIPNAHEAIISKEDFEEAQKRRKEKTMRFCNQKQEPHKYVGLLFCGKCKTVMRKRYLASLHGYDGYMCGFRQKMGQNYCEWNHITFEQLDELVVDAINQQLKQRKEDWSNTKSHMVEWKAGTGEKLALLEKKIERNQEERKKAYERFLEDRLEKEEYLEIKQRYEQEKNDYEKQRKEQIIIAENEERRMRAFKEGNLTVEQLTRAVLSEFIDRIEIYPDQKMEIFFKVASDNPVTGKTESKGGNV